MSEANKNNFNLIRLIAALQVVFTHGVHHFELGSNIIVHNIGYYFLYYFPGVPIFFTISGFLIYKSYSRNYQTIKVYIFNRFIRLYPALWLCLIITTGLILYFYSENRISFLFSKTFLMWFFEQATFFQFHTPDVMRFWGMGTPNGSLWTIIVEIQFYLLVPIIYNLLKIKKSFTFHLLILLALSSILFNIFISHLGRDTVALKLIGVSIFPFLYNFLFGVIMYIFWDNLKHLCIGKFSVWITLYLFYVLIFGVLLKYDMNSYLIETPFHLISNILLTFVTLSAAYSNTTLSYTTIRDIDISYGLYIYHMPLVNTLLSLGYIGNVSDLFVLLLIVIPIAYLSWEYLESRMLKLKYKQV